MSIRRVFCELWFVILGICSLKTEDWRLKTVKSDSHDCAFPQPIGAWQLDHGGNFVSAHHFGTITKSVLKSRFCAISSDFCDFTRFQPDFTHFWFFQAIQHVKHVLTRNIIWFYESKCNFNNLDIVRPKDIGSDRLLNPYPLMLDCGAQPKGVGSSSSSYICPIGFDM